MKSETMNKLITLGSNLAVFLGLVLVAFEIHQTQVQLDLSASADATDNFANAMQVLSTDEGLADLVYRAETDFPHLDEFDKWRLFKYLDGYMAMTQQDFLVMMEAEVDLTGISYDWEKNMARPMYQAYWAERNARYPDYFRQFIDNASNL